jgi:hypothetical protein
MKPDNLGPPKEGGPVTDRATTTATTRTDTAEHSVPWRQDWHEPLTAVDWLAADAAIIAASRRHGYRIARPCAVCGHWLTADASVRAGIGPACLRREREAA